MKYLKAIYLSVIVSLIAGVVAADLIFFGTLWLYHHAGSPGAFIIYVVNGSYTGILAGIFGGLIGGATFAAIFTEFLKFKVLTQ